MSGKALLAANIVVMAVLLASGAGFSDIVWTYWIESAAIGFFAALSMFMASIQSKEQRGVAAGLLMSGFFCIHYGLFHAAYLILLPALHIWPGPQGFALVALGGGILSLAHLFLFFENELGKREVERRAVLSMKSVIAHSSDIYRAIAPMHIVMVLAIVASLLSIADVRVKIILVLILMGVKTATTRKS